MFPCHYLCHIHTSNCVDEFRETIQCSFSLIVSSPQPGRLWGLLSVALCGFVVGRPGTGRSHSPTGRHFLFRDLEPTCAIGVICD